MRKHLENAKVRELFGHFLAKELNVEGLLFLESCVEFFQAPPTIAMEAFRNLESNHFRANAPFQVNISRDAAAAVGGVKSLDDARAAVELAEIDINRLVGNDPLRRFMRDPEYLAFLATEDGVEFSAGIDDAN